MIVKSHLYINPMVSRMPTDSPLTIRLSIQWLKKLFLKHPHEAGETYFQHLRFTLGMAAHIALTAIIIVVHGILPFLFVKTASKRIAGMNRIMQARLYKLAEKADKQFDI